MIISTFTHPGQHSFIFVKQGADLVYTIKLLNTRLCSPIAKDLMSRGYSPICTIDSPDFIQFSDLPITALKGNLVALNPHLN